VDGPDRPTLLREGLIWLGFALLCVAAALTVAAPELRDDSELDPPVATAAADAGR
jgi:hypothetical protein